MNGSKGESFEGYKEGRVHKRKEDVGWNQFGLSTNSYLMIVFLPFSFWVEIQYSLCAKLTKSVENKGTTKTSQTKPKDFVPQFQHSLPFTFFFIQFFFGAAFFCGSTFNIQNLF